jgi:hypothetical protein
MKHKELVQQKLALMKLDKDEESLRECYFAPRLVSQNNKKQSISTKVSPNASFNTQSLTRRSP